jgi:hypothetical protein
MMTATEITIGNSTEPKRDERRHPRYVFVADVEIVDLKSGSKMTAHTSDFSRGGCYIDMLWPLPQDTVVKLRLTKWRHTLEARAKVIHSSAGMGMGLMFGALDATQQAIVETWLTELSGVQPC